MCQTQLTMIIAETCCKHNCMQSWKCNWKWLLLLRQLQSSRNATETQPKYWLLLQCCRDSCKHIAELLKCSQKIDYCYRIMCTDWVCSVELHSSQYRSQSSNENQCRCHMHNRSMQSSRAEMTAVSEANSRTAWRLINDVRQLKTRCGSTTANTENGCAQQSSLATAVI